MVPGYIVLKWCYYRVWYIKWCLQSSYFIGATRSKAGCTKWPRTIIESRCTVMCRLCRALSILCFKNCWLFNNNELSPADVKLKRNFGICASLKYLSISVNAIWYFMLFGKNSEGQIGVFIPHFVNNSFSSFRRFFMQKICTRCNAH